jgi:hypothetical protein
MCHTLPLHIMHTHRSGGGAREAYASSTGSAAGHKYPAPPSPTRWVAKDTPVDGARPAARAAAAARAAGVGRAGLARSSLEELAAGSLSVSLSSPLSDSSSLLLLAWVYVRGGWVGVWDTRCANGCVRGGGAMHNTRTQIYCSR